MIREVSLSGALLTVEICPRATRPSCQFAGLMYHPFAGSVYHLAA
jgi:hypothetical protein